MRVILWIMVGCTFLFGDDSLFFTERRYMAALGVTRSLEGTLELREDSLKITYTQPLLREIVLTPREIQVIEGADGAERRIDRDKQPELSIFLEILERFLRQGTAGLEADFTLKSDPAAGYLELLPKQVSVRKVLQKVELFKDDGESEAWKRVVMHFTNEDVVTFEKR